MSARRNTLIIAALVCATVLPAACGSDDATTTPSSAATADTTAPMTTEPATTEPMTTDAVTTEPATTEPATTEAAPKGSIIDVATAAGNFTTLLAAVEAAGLTETLATSKLTLLAPTDEAFAALGQATIDAVLADPVALTALLQNHVLPAPQDAKTISIFSNVVNLNGTSLPVVVDGATVTIGGATVITADIEADNGYIHVIDTVIVPAAA
ncbi:MAG: fasciclin domain-containing protein [Ilumatobacteraceae bacterium]